MGWRRCTRPLVGRLAHAAAKHWTDVRHADTIRHAALTQKTQIKSPLALPQTHFSSALTHTVVPHYRFLLAPNSPTYPPDNLAFQTHRLTVKTYIFLTDFLSSQLILANLPLFINTVSSHSSSFFFSCTFSLLVFYAPIHHSQWPLLPHTTVSTHLHNRLIFRTPRLQV